MLGPTSSPPTLMQSTSLTLDELDDRINKFCIARGWGKAHTPRNLLFALIGEMGELSEIFQWRGEVAPGLPDFSEHDRIHTGEEMSDVLIYLMEMARCCGIDLAAATINKVSKNAKKYPPIEGLVDTTALYLVDPRALTFGTLAEETRKFSMARNWSTELTPRNLLLALVAEVGELSEIFQWRGEVEPGLPDFTEHDKVHVGEEMADVLLYLVQLARVCGINLSEAVQDKMLKNAIKYPAMK
ncbi:type II deoxyuridine triphosphatase [Rhizoclosmatium globosum]|uniref:Type II deoxyuridine triphosphatase n=1 Tax=Rhizoclosmatium globosum TaxID=329046 RepID=A0A1Y2CKU3_9FUNG|nr:type II deoxyuridine triphosphatase [Rhizoclosmatium globosum]|eukprot:ORY47606.1 type II deoxyuridine triphosphatase [Rhizoclosmatium globosum]